MGVFDFLKRRNRSNDDTDGKIREAMPYKNKCSEYRKGVADSGKDFKLEDMPENEAIMHILQEIGMKPEIANNADAVRTVSNIVKEINEKLAVKSENLEKIKEQLKGIVDSDGKIVVYDIGLDAKLQTIMVDVNKEGQCIYTNKMATIRSENGITISNDITLTITIEDGIEMSSYIKNDTTATGYLNMKSESVACTITRNTNLVTAHVVMESGDFLRNKTEGQVLLDGMQINKLPRKIELEKFMNESPNAKKSNNDRIKETLEKGLDSSEKFKKLAIKKGVVKDRKNR